MHNATHVIETSANKLFAVCETGDSDLAHVWHGTEVRRSKGGYVQKANARWVLVRKAASRIVHTL